MTDKTSKDVIHFYAGWCGKVLCAAIGSPVSSIKADDVTCDACKTMLNPAKLIEALSVDGDEVAKIEDGWGDPSGAYLKYRGQVWVNDGWLDMPKVRALRDWLSKVLGSADETTGEAVELRAQLAQVRSEYAACIKTVDQLENGASETTTEPDAWLVEDGDGWRYLAGGEGDARARLEGYPWRKLYPLYRGAVKATAPPEIGKFPRCEKHGVEMAFIGDECWECKREAQS